MKKNKSKRKDDACGICPDCEALARNVKRHGRAVEAALSAARATWGPGWDLLGYEQQAGAVALATLRVLVGRDGDEPWQKASDLADVALNWWAVDNLPAPPIS